MLWVALAGVLTFTVTAVMYLGRERMGPASVLPVALRTLAISALVLLIVNPSSLRPEDAGGAAVLVDASLSMGGRGGAWRRAVDTAHVLAGDAGLALQFVPEVEPLDTLPPSAGVTRIDAALVAGRQAARVVLVTDGEVADPPWRSPPPGVDVVLIPRDTVADAALMDVRLAERVLLHDTIRVAVEVATWGEGLAEAGTLEIRAGSHEMLRERLSLPPPPGRSVHTFWVPLGALGAGDHVVRIRLTVVGDQEPGDNERARVLTVADQPAIVVIVDPADWEGRYLSQVLGEVVQAPVRGFARLADQQWIALPTLERVDPDRVQRATRQAALVVVRGAPTIQVGADRRWDWPAGAGGPGQYIPGDWYVASELPPSPIAGALAGADWGQLPPVLGMEFLGGVTDSTSRWVALTVRRGRRGPERPLLVLQDSGSKRTALTAGSGLWRWALRGGESREAYRTLVAAGADWLLADHSTGQRDRVHAAPVTPRGVPVRFEWIGESPPDSLPVLFAHADSSFRLVLLFDPDGVAAVALDTGEFRWRAPGGDGAGTLVVEPYSPEIPPGAVTILGGRGAAVRRGMEVPARARPLWFVIAIAALVGEWAWRQRAGLA